MRSVALTATLLAFALVGPAVAQTPLVVNVTPAGFGLEALGRLVVAGVAAATVKPSCFSAFEIAAPIPRLPRHQCYPSHCVTP